MKKITKLIVLLLTLCQIAGCFAACKKDAEGTEDSSEPAFDLTAEQLSEYKLVIPHTTQTTMRSVATKLQGMIEKITGAKPEIKTEPKAEPVVTAEPAAAPAPKAEEPVVIKEEPKAEPVAVKAEPAPAPKMEEPANNAATEQADAASDQKVGFFGRLFGRR